jgi:hypothetical protein
MKLNELTHMDPPEAEECLAAFEQYIRDQDLRGLNPDYFLKKLESFDELNPEFRDRGVDGEWKIWRMSWIACARGRS